MSEKAGFISMMFLCLLSLVFCIFMFIPHEHFKGKIINFKVGTPLSYALLDGGRIVKLTLKEDGHNMINGVGDSIEGYIQFSGNTTITKVFHPDTLGVVK
jgi:hypothetical protein